MKHDETNEIRDAVPPWTKAHCELCGEEFQFTRTEPAPVGKRRICGACEVYEAYEVAVAAPPPTKLHPLWGDRKARREWRKDISANAWQAVALDIDGPPCSHCAHWCPHVRVGVSECEGITLCKAEDMYSDFSCYKAKP
jgi:hypothetical protein